jgi:hypothetical protein
MEPFGTARSTRRRRGCRRTTWPARSPRWRAVGASWVSWSRAVSLSRPSDGIRRATSSLAAVCVRRTRHVQPPGAGSCRAPRWARSSRGGGRSRPRAGGRRRRGLVVGRSSKRQARSHAGTPPGGDGPLGAPQHLPTAGAAGGLRRRADRAGRRGGARERHRPRPAGAPTTLTVSVTVSGEVGSAGLDRQGRPRDDPRHRPGVPALAEGVAVAVLVQRRRDGGQGGALAVQLHQPLQAVLAVHGH